MKPQKVEKVVSIDRDFDLLRKREWERARQQVRRDRVIVWGPGLVMFGIGLIVWVVCMWWYRPQ